MTDYFALLAQPRTPWLDPNQLVEEFRRRVKLEHPDAGVGSPDSGNNFAELNTAYRVLTEPSSRLAHLLELSGEKVGSISQPPVELSDLFFSTASAIDEVRAGNSVPAEAHLQKLQTLQAATIESLRGIDQTDISSIKRAHEKLSYFDRWIAQLGERLLDHTIG